MGTIIGYEKEKKELANLRKMLHNAERYRSAGIRIPRGLALYGEPGVGKTQLARSIVDEGINLIEMRAAMCCEENAEEELQSVFERAREHQPSVILLDELDKIAGTSLSFYMKGNNNIQKVLLQELDRLTDADTVLVVATCNETYCLGEALLRPGRFDRQLCIELPDEETRTKIISGYFNRISLKNNLDYSYISKLTAGHSGASLECLVNEVGIVAFEEEKELITIEDVRRVINKMAFDGEEKKPVTDKERQRMIAVHEAGHTVVALKLMPDKIFSASILPQGGTNGHVRFARSNTDVCLVSEVEDEVKVSLAGHVAERVVLGEYLVGSSSDILSAEAKIRGLTIREGAYGYEPMAGSGIVRGESATAESTKDTYSRIITAKLNELDREAEKIITKNRELFDRITEALTEKQTLTREELISLEEECRETKEAA